MFGRVLDALAWQALYDKNLFKNPALGATVNHRFVVSKVKVEVNVLKLKISSKP